MPAYLLFASRGPTWSRSFLPPSGLMTAEAKSSVTVPTATRPGPVRLRRPPHQQPRPRHPAAVPPADEHRRRPPGDALARRHRGLELLGVEAVLHHQQPAADARRLRCVPGGQPALRVRRPDGHGLQPPRGQAGRRRQPRHEHHIEPRHLHRLRVQLQRALPGRRQPVRRHGLRTRDLQPLRLALRPEHLPLLRHHRRRRRGAGADERPERPAGQRSPRLAPVPGRVQDGRRLPVAVRLGGLLRGPQPAGTGAQRSVERAAGGVRRGRRSHPDRPRAAEPAGIHLQRADQRGRPELRQADRRRQRADSDRRRRLQHPQPRHHPAEARQLRGVAGERAGGHPGPASGPRRRCRNCADTWSTTSTATPTSSRRAPRPGRQGTRERSRTAAPRPRRGWCGRWRRPH